MPLPADVAEMLVDPAARKKRLAQIIAETGSLPDWRTHEDNNGGGDGVEAGSTPPAAEGGGQREFPNGDETV